MPRWRITSMGRARYSRGYVTLTDTNLWQAHWFPYVRDPNTGVEKRQHRTQIVGTKAKMRRYQAEEELRKITDPVNASSGRIDQTTLGGFIEKRWKPLHEGDWREESTRPANELFLKVICERFGKTPVKDLDSVELQEWINELARKRSQTVVLHVRTLLKSICNEAMEQEYLTKDPTRKLRTPKNIRETDKTVLSWDELRRVFNASSQRDRLIISIEGIAGLRPSELFALRRQSFDGHRLTIAETIYRGKLRDYGKTKGSLTTVELPEELANPVGAWLEALADKSPAAFLFPNSDGGFILKDNYLHRVLYPLGKQLGLAKLNFQVLRRTFSTLAQKHGNVKDVQRQMRHAKPDLTAEVYMQAIPESVQKMVAEMYAQLLKPATEALQ
jgi:integrase